MKLKIKYKIIGVLLILVLIIFVIKNNTNSKLDNINNYLKDNRDNIVEKIEFDNIFEVVTKIDDEYKVTLFNKDTDDVIDLEDIITNEEEFNKKIDYLLKLKYPDYICEKIVNSKNQVYYLKVNELVIYDYD